MNRKALNKAVLSIVRLNDCSGSFVSNEGLILTSVNCIKQHLPFQLIQKIEKRPVFIAYKRSEELPLKKLNGFVSAQVEDVSQSLLTSLPKTLSGYNYLKILRFREAKLIQQCHRDSTIHCKIVSSTHHSPYHLLKEHLITDIRLVFAEKSNDHGADGFALVRAYHTEGDRAEVVKPKAHLSLTTEMEPKDQSLIIVAGFPQNTHHGASHSEYLFAWGSFWPKKRIILQNYRQTIKAFIDQDADLDMKLGYLSLLTHLDRQIAAINYGLNRFKDKALLQQSFLNDIKFIKWLKQSPISSNHWEQYETLSRIWQAFQLDEMSYDLMTRSTLLNQHLLTSSAEYQKSFVHLSDHQEFETLLMNLDHDHRLEPELDAKLWMSSLLLVKRLRRKTNDFPHELQRLYHSSGNLLTRIHRIYGLTGPSQGKSNTRLKLLTQNLMPYQQQRAYQQQELEGKLLQMDDIISTYRESFFQEVGRPMSYEADGTPRLIYGFTTIQSSLGHTRNLQPPEIKNNYCKINHKPKILSNFSSSQIFLSNTPINTGNSGAATLNSKGELLAMVMDQPIKAKFSHWRVNGAKPQSKHRHVRSLIWSLKQLCTPPPILKELLMQ